MDGAIDLRLVVSIAGILISLGGAMAVTKQSLKVQAEFIRDLESRLRQLDSRTDRITTQIETQAQRVSVLSGILDPQLSPPSIRVRPHFRPPRRRSWRPLKPKCRHSVTCTTANT